MISKIIFDIETVGQDLDAFDEATRNHFLKYAKSPDEEQEVRDSMGFYPLTAQVVAIAMLEADSDQAFVYYQVPGEQPARICEGGAEYFSASGEKQLLELFWGKIQKYDQFVTFNGRSFDCPFLMIRSGIHRIRASKNLMPDRYRSNSHIDLMEKLTFLGAFRRRFSLHMWCQAFGIKSPKAGGMTGLDVKDFFKSARHREIAEYCLGDVAATKELFLCWEKFINVPGA